MCLLHDLFWDVARGTLLGLQSSFDTFPHQALSSHPIAPVPVHQEGVGALKITLRSTGSLDHHFSPRGGPGDLTYYTVKHEGVLERFGVERIETETGIGRTEGLGLALVWPVMLQTG